MRNVIIQYLILGFTLAAAPGAVLTESIRRAIMDKKTVLSFTAGNFIGLTIVILISYAGATFLTQNFVLQKILYGLGGVVIIALGVQAILHKPQYHAVHPKAKRHIKKRYTAFLTGLMLSAGNPIRFIFWTSFVGGLAYKSVNSFDAALYGLIVYVGFGAFYILLVALLLVLGRRFKNIHFSVVAKIIGAILVVYGLAMIARLVEF